MKLSRQHRVNVTIQRITLEDLVLLRNAISDLQNTAVNGQLKFLEGIVDSLTSEELDVFKEISGSAYTSHFDTRDFFVNGDDY